MYCVVFFQRSPIVEYFATRLQRTPEYFRLLMGRSPVWSPSHEPPGPFLEKRCVCIPIGHPIINKISHPFFLLLLILFEEHFSFMALTF